MIIFSINEKINEIIKELNITTQSYENDVKSYEYDNNLITNISQTSLLCAPKLIIIKDASSLFNNKKSPLNEFLDFIKNDPNTSYLLISDKKVNNIDGFKIFTIQELDKKNVKLYVEQILKQHHLTLSKELYTHLLNALNLDKNIIQNEINKIILLKKSNVNDEEIKKVICNYNDENIFKLLECIISKNQAMVFKIYENLKLKKQDEMAIIIILSNQLNQMIMYKKLSNKRYSNNEIAKYLSLPVFAIINYQQLLSNITLEQLISLNNAFFELEINIKNAKIDKVLGFKNFLISVL